MLAAALAHPPPGGLCLQWGQELCHKLSISLPFHPAPARQLSGHALLLATFFNVSPDPKTLGAGEKGAMTPTVLLWTYREEEGWVSCGEGHKGNLQGLLSRPLCPPSSWQETLVIY